MTVREELCRAGAGLVVAHVYTKQGKRVPVLDPARRRQAAILKLLMSGQTPRQTARALRIPLSTVCVLGIRALKQRGKISNLHVDRVGNNP